MRIASVLWSSRGMGLALRAQLAQVGRGVILIRPAQAAQRQTVRWHRAGLPTMPL